MKQKQTQNVKIVIGDVAKKRRAPRRAPRRVAPHAGGPPGSPGSGGGPNIPFPRGPSVAGAPGYFSFPPRSGPAVEPVSQLQQLIRPIEQTLQRLLLGPPAPALAPIPALSAPAPSVSAQDVREFVARFTQPLFERIEQPVYSSSSSSSSSTPSYSSSSTPSYATASSSAFFQELGEMSTQTEISMPDHTAQYQLVAPEPALVRAVEPPLIDALVHPDEIIIEEEEELPIIRDYTVEDIQRLNREGQINQQFLQRFQVSAIRPNTRGMNLLKIGRALGISFPTEYKRATKQVVTDFIVQKLANPNL